MGRITKPHNLLLTAGLALSVIALQSHSSLATTKDIYRYHGLKSAQGLEAKDGIFQDFSETSDNLGKIWADPDAIEHQGSQPSWVKGIVNRTGIQPHLTIEFARQGYGANLAISPKNRTPEIIPTDAVLQFEARSNEPACMGLRFMDRDGEIWTYGPKVLEYDRLCVDPNNQWTHFSIPIAAQHPNWLKFPHSGNIDLGNDSLEAEMVAMLSLELGLAGGDYLAPGRASLDIRNIQIQSDPKAHLPTPEATTTIQTTITPKNTAKEIPVVEETQSLESLILNLLKLQAGNDSFELD